MKRWKFLFPRSLSDLENRIETLPELTLDLLNKKNQQLTYRYNMHKSKATSHLLQETKKYNRELIKLWTGIRKGDKESLGRLYSEFYTEFFNYGYKLTKRKAIVKDCIQELFLTIWKKRFSISRATFVKSYLYTSFRRILFGRLKKEKNRIKRSWHYIEMYSNREDNVENLLIRLELEEENKNKLYNLINSLSPRQKEAIKLKYYEGYSSNEIAILMNINKQSVYNHISKAVGTLQSMVK